MPTVNSPSLTLTTVGQNVTVDVTYNAFLPRSTSSRRPA